MFSFVVAIPVYNILSASPEYFVANRIGSMGIYQLALSVSLFLPLYICAPLCLGFVRRHRMGYLGFWVAVFVAMWSVQLIGRLSILPGWISISLSMIFGIVAGRIYLSRRFIGSFLTALSPLVIIVPLVFLLSDNIRFFLKTHDESRRVVATSLAHKPPIVFVIFDEFPLVDLLDSSGDIDATRYPNFAELASNSTWYNNATTVWFETMLSIPSILTGNRPRLDSIPVVDDYPNNLFSILEPHYDLHIYESAAHLAPSQELDADYSILQLGTMITDMAVVFSHVLLPEDLAGVLPPIDNQWGGFIQDEEIAAESALKKSRRSRRRHLVNDMKVRLNPNTENREVIFERFIDSMNFYPTECLHFIHILLPHGPHKHLPSGTIYTDHARDWGAHTDGRNLEWVGSPIALEHAHHRQNLQIAFVDRLLGQLIDRMKSLDIYDKSLIVITSDHGRSHQFGVSVRIPHRENFGDVGFVPMFIKQPGQREGERDTSNVQTIDVVPTILDVLGAEIDLSFDGRSLIDSDAPVPPLKNFPNRRGEAIEYTREQYLQAKQTALEKNVDRFSLADPRSNNFHFGVALDLVNRPLSELTLEPLPGIVNCEQLTSLKQVDPNARYIPLRLKGVVNDFNKSDLSTACVVVSVNGIVQGAARPFLFEERVLFDIVLPESAIGKGTNDVTAHLFRLDD